MIRQFIALIRGLVHRWGSALLILAVAVVAVATAAAGPIYYQAAQRSILTDVITAAPVIGRSYEATATGPVRATLPALQAAVTKALDRHLAATGATRAFARPVDTIEASDFDAKESQSFPLVWRTAQCAHLTITGRCPAAANQVIVSRSDAAISGWRIGDHIPASGWLPELTITGVYQPPRLTGDYWELHAAIFFPREDGGGLAHDAVFTSLATMTRAPAAEQGTSIVDRAIVPHQISVPAVRGLQTALTGFVDDIALSPQQIIIESAVPATLAKATQQWRAIAVPITVTTATMLLLSLLLLFLIVTEAVEARGSDIALAKLRGHGRLGVLIFGLSEPAVLLAVALPAGLAAGWAGAATLAHALLVPGTAVGLPPIAIAAAVASVTGGFAALILAAHRALRRGVLEQLRRSGQQASGRGWVVDAVLLTGCTAGLVEVFTTGRAGTASRGWLDLLVPGLLGLAVAVVASRLLPLACRALYGLTSRRGGLARFLAIRHIARRDSGVRTTMVLASAFALAAFALAGWTVSQRNYQLVARAEVGAAEVLTVHVPPGRDLGTIVAKADPSGRRAAAVESYVGLNGSAAGQTTLAVDPARFARVAFWPVRLTAQDVSSLTKSLQPRAVPPIVLDGDALRVTVLVRWLSNPGEQMYANVTQGSSPVSLGALPRRGKLTLTGPLTGCPCMLQSLSLTAPGARISNGQSSLRLSASLTLASLQVRRHDRWVPAVEPAVLGSTAEWRDQTQGIPHSAGESGIAAGRAGLTWTINGLPGQYDPTLGPADVPEPMPALVAAPLVRNGQQLASGNGLDGSPLLMRISGVLPYVPSALANGAIVDRRYAELAAQQNLGAADQQVWLASGALPGIAPRLAAAGVRIGSVSSVAATVARLSRQGPALASALFVMDAGAVAFLAAAAAIVGLYASARRRRYEYAAMEATGVRRRDLRISLLLEMAVALGFGAVVGTLTGLLAARLVLGNVPEFTSRPAIAVVSYAPPAGPMAVLLGAMAVLLAVTALTSSSMLIGGIRSDVLRESPL